MCVDPNSYQKIRAYPKGDFSGLITSGNIELDKRPIVQNSDGSISTVASSSYNIEGKEILLPTVSDDGRMMDDNEAVDTYRRTGKHLGIFDTPENASKYAEALHIAQEKYYKRKKRR